MISSVSNTIHNFILHTIFPILQIIFAHVEINSYLCSGFSGTYASIVQWIE